MNGPGNTRKDRVSPNKPRIMAGEQINDKIPHGYNIRIVG